MNNVAGRPLPPLLKTLEVGHRGASLLKNEGVIMDKEVAMLNEMSFANMASFGSQGMTISTLYVFVQVWSSG